MSRSPNRILPLVGSSMPAIMFMVVDLPQPDGPSSAMNSPSAMSRSMVFSAVKSPNFLVELVEMDGAHAATPAPAAAIRCMANTASDRQHDQDGERDRRDIAPDQVLGGDLVDVDGDGLGGDAGPAAGHDVERVEDLEVLDQPDGQRDDDDRLHLRQHDGGEALPGIGAEQRRRLDLIVRHPDQAGEQDQEHQRRPLPDVGDHHRDQRQRRVGQPGDRDRLAGQRATGCRSPGRRIGTA